MHCTDRTKHTAAVRCCARVYNQHHRRQCGTRAGIHPDDGEMDVYFAHYTLNKQTERICAVCLIVAQNEHTKLIYLAFGYHIEGK